MSTQTIPLTEVLPGQPLDPFAALDEHTHIRHQSFGEILRRRFQKNRAAVVCLWVLVVLFSLCFPLAFLAGSPETVRIEGHDGLPKPPTFGGEGVVGLYDKASEPQLEMYGSYAATAVTLEAFNKKPPWITVRDDSGTRTLKLYDENTQLFLGGEEQSLDDYEIGGQYTLLTRPLGIHPFGLDTLGRDYLARCLFGGRISLTVGFVAVAIAVSIGTVLGAWAGFFAGISDRVISSLTEIMLGMPTFFLIIAVQSALSPSIYNVMMVLGIFSWMGVSRLVRGQVLHLKEEEYIQASRASGAGIFRILFRHLIPNAVGPIIVAATLAIPGAILTEAALSYFGMGVQPPMPSWGNMITDAKGWLTRGLEMWWLVTFPGLLIAVAVIAFNFLGEGLRDALDPRS